VLTLLNKNGGFMTNRKLVELYGKRFTPLAKLAGSIIIVIAGILIAFNQDDQNKMTDRSPAVEQSASD
jgi:hypothetical protein